MRHVYLFTLFSAFAACAGCESKRSATDVVRAAIQAHGGADNFAKTRICEADSSIDGEFMPGLSGKFVVHDWLKLPGKEKRTVKGVGRGPNGDEKLDFVWVLNGDQVWLQIRGGEPMAMPPDAPINTNSLTRALELLEAFIGPDFRLSLESDENINGNPCYRIRVESQGQWIRDLFFDKETKLLVASRKEISDAQTQSRHKIETFFSEFKTFSSLTLPTQIRVVGDGATTCVEKVNTAVFLDDLPEELFQKPIKTAPGF